MQPVTGRAPLSMSGTIAQTATARKRSRSHRHRRGLDMMHRKRTNPTPNSTWLWAPMQIGPAGTSLSIFVSESLKLASFFVGSTAPNQRMSQVPRFVRVAICREPPSRRRSHRACRTAWPPGSIGPRSA
jgi:hypothetical protein